MDTVYLLGKDAFQRLDRAVANGGGKPGFTGYTMNGKPAFYSDELGADEVREVQTKGVK